MCPFNGTIQSRFVLILNIAKFSKSVIKRFDKSDKCNDWKLIHLIAEMKIKGYKRFLEKIEFLEILIRSSSLESRGGFRGWKYLLQSAPRISTLRIGALKFTGSWKRISQTQFHLIAV